MPKFQAEAPHALGRDAALERLQSFMGKIEEQYGEQVSSIESEWVDDVLEFALTTYGMTIKGTLSVEDDRAEVLGKLPLAAAAFRGKIEKSIAQALESALA